MPVVVTKSPESTMNCFMGRFRSTPINGHRRRQSVCLKRANKRHCWRDWTKKRPPTEAASFLLGK